MAPRATKKRRATGKNTLREDDPDAQDHVSYRKEKKKLKSGQEKTRLVAQILNEIAGWPQKAGGEDAGSSDPQAAQMEHADVDVEMQADVGMPDNSMPMPHKPQKVLILHQVSKFLT